MPRRSLVLSVCVAALLGPLAVLVAGCGRTPERVTLAKHGVGRLVYKQLHAVSRAAESAALDAADEDEDEAAAGADTGDPGGDLQPPGPAGVPEPAARTDVPPDPWVAAFPAPDVPPMPIAPTSALPTALEKEPAPAVAAAPPAPPAPEPAVEPTAAELPAQEGYTEPQVVVFVPGAGNNGQVAAAAPQIPTTPTFDGPVVNVVVVPIIGVQLPGNASTRRHVANPAPAHRQAPAQPHIGARPTLHLGGPVGVPAPVRRR